LSQNVEITFNLIIAAPDSGVDMLRAATVKHPVLRFVTLLLSGSVK
jgi:hypothetical protein